MRPDIGDRVDRRCYTDIERDGRGRDRWPILYLWSRRIGNLARSGRSTGAGVCTLQYNRWYDLDTINEVASATKAVRSFLSVPLSCFHVFDIIDLRAESSLPVHDCCFGAYTMRLNRYDVQIWADRTGQKTDGNNLVTLRV